MRFKKIALALFACLALGAFAASAAQAAEGEGWTIGTTENQTSAGTLIPNGTHERISCKKHGTSPLVFTSSLLGSAIEMTVEGIDCLEKAGSTNAATIDNTTTKGHGATVLTFTGVKVVKPANCEIGGATHDLTTAALTEQVFMDPTAGSTVVFDKFASEVEKEVEVEGKKMKVYSPVFTLEFSGALCSLAEIQTTFRGGICGESVHTNAGGTEYEPNKTGTLTKVQTLLFGAAQQTTGNSTEEPCALTAGAQALTLTGALDTELASGKPFGSD